VAWVRIPYISGSVDTDIYMYYGNDTAADQSNPTGVWDTTFKGVWHLNESVVDENITVGIHTDSTSNGNDGNQNGNVTVPGQITGGQSFDGDGDHILVPHDESLNLTGSMTISAWICPTQDTTTYNRIIDKTFTTSYYFGCGYGTNDLTFYLNRNEVIETPDNTITPNKWQNIAVTYDNSGNAIIYLNGQKIGDGVYTGGISGNTNPLYISHSDTTYDFTGYIDEVRISTAVHTAEWIETSYKNQTDAAGSIMIGSEMEYPFTPGTGVFDYSLQNNFGEFKGGLSSIDITRGKDGKGLNFDGVDDYIDLGNDPSLKLTADMTIEAWAKPAVNDANMGIAGNLYGSGDNVSNYSGFGLAKLSSNRFCFMIGDGGPSLLILESDSYFTDNDWHHVVGVRQRGINYLYIDGEIQSASGYKELGDGGRYAFIGRRNSSYNGGFFNGIIDEVKIYNRSLSPEEISVKYNSINN
jgi:hypothetical protein